MTIRLGLAALTVGVALAGAACNEGKTRTTGTVAFVPVKTTAITVNWGREPVSLDPARATDPVSANILLNIMDPLVRLDRSGRPVPNLARSWKVSPDGKTVTIELRADGDWTNGDAVNAADFVLSWKRTLSPQLAAGNADQLYGIVGAKAYNKCRSRCNALRDKVGVKATGPTTLRIGLASPERGFIRRLAQPAFLAVNVPAVERSGYTWTEISNLVTSGPYVVALWHHGSRIDLVRWDAWRNAKQVRLQRVNGQMISDGAKAVRSFEAGDLDVTDRIPSGELSRLEPTPEFSRYPGHTELERTSIKDTYNLNALGVVDLTKVRIEGKPAQ